MSVTGSTYFTDTGKRKKQTYFWPNLGPMGGPQSTASKEINPDTAQSYYHNSAPKHNYNPHDAATFNLPDKLGFPNSARGLSMDGSLGDLLFKNAGDPKSEFPFYFKSVDILSWNFGNIPFIGDIDFRISEFCTFQATIKSLKEDYKPQIRKKHYFGRSEAIQTYQYTTRTIGTEFVIYAESFAGLQHLKERVNFLAKSVYPTYEGGAIGGIIDWAINAFSADEKLKRSKDRYKEPPIMLVTIGDLFVDLPVVATSVSFDWNTTGRWEREPGVRTPQACSVRMDMTVLHKILPSRSLGTDMYPEWGSDFLYGLQGPDGSVSKARSLQGIKLLTEDLESKNMVKNLQKLAQVKGLFGS